MDRADVERKFRGNVARWPKQRTDAVLRMVWELEKVDDLSALLGQLAA